MMIKIFVILISITLLIRCGAPQSQQEETSEDVDEYLYVATVDDLFNGPFSEIESGSKLNFKDAVEFEDLCFECANSFGLSYEEINTVDTLEYLCIFSLNIRMNRPYSDGIRYMKYIGVLKAKPLSNGWKYSSRWAKGLKDGLGQMDSRDWPINDGPNETKLISCFKSWSPVNSQQ
jgi:hypothetical protein